MRVLKLVMLGLFLVAPLTSCFVKEKSVECPRPAAVQVASGCVWVQEYRDAQGRVHAAHYRCPGTIDAY